MFTGLVWLTSNQMFGSGKFWDKSPSWFLKIYKNALGQFIPTCPLKHVITNTNVFLQYCCAALVLKILIHFYWSCRPVAGYKFAKKWTPLWVFFTDSRHNCNTTFLRICSWWLLRHKKLQKFILQNDSQWILS